MTDSLQDAPEELRAEASRLWPETAGLDWIALTPDGSDRTYWRLGAPGASRVLMVYRGQNATGVDGFLEVHRLLERHGLPVARIEAADPASGLFLLEDLGDTTLEAAVQSDAADALYDEAIELLGRIQRIAPEPSSPRPRCFELAFDAAKLAFEMDFFLEHLVGGLLGLDPESPAWKPARDELRRYCAWLGERHPVLVHRDFHCRNFMVHEGRLRLLDYQDARMGRHSYDLVSLLYDSYADIGDMRRSRLLDLYERVAPKPLQADWREELLPMAVQRNLKALGSFGYLMTKKGKRHFTGAIATTLGHLRLHLRGPELPATRAFVLGPLHERCAELGLAPKDRT